MENNYVALVETADIPKIDYIDISRLQQVRKFIVDMQFFTPFMKRKFFLDVKQIERMSVENYIIFEKYFIDQIQVCSECRNGFNCRNTDQGVWEKLTEYQQRSATRGFIYIPRLNEFNTLYMKEYICEGVHIESDANYYWRKLSNKEQNTILDKRKCEPQDWDIETLKKFIQGEKNRWEKKSKW